VNKALFLDRDGTIIEDRGYLADPEGVLLLAGAAEALRELHSEGWQLVVVSNQSGVGRGFITRDQMDAVQTRFLETMEEHGVSIAASYLCVHSPEENCECRKPLPFFLKQASREHSIDLSASWMIGDREGDIHCGRNAGCSTIWLRNELFAVPEDLAAFTAENWEEIYRKVSASH